MTDVHPITPAPDCEFQRTEVNGVPECTCRLVPCDRVPGCGYDRRLTSAAIRREKIGMLDRLEMVEG